MSRELYVIEAMSSAAERRRPDRRRVEEPEPLTPVMWRQDAQRMLLGRTIIVGPFPDYHAAHRWLHWHHNTYDAMVIHRMIPPSDDESDAMIGASD